MKPETKSKRLAKKEHLTGKDLGEVLLVDLALQIQSNKNHKPQPPPTIPRDKVTELVNYVSDKQRNDFNIYASLYNAIVRGLKEEALLRSQVFHAFYKLHGYQKDVINFETQYETARSRPMIITQPAYKALIDKAVSARAYKDISYYSLFFYTLAYFLMLEKQPLLLPPEIRAELDALKGAKLPPAADTPTAEPKPPLDTMEACKLIYEGKGAILDHLKATAPALDLSPLEAMKENELLDYLEELGGSTFLEAPKLQSAASQGRTKHDLLEGYIEAFKQAEGQPGEKQAARATLKAFKDEYPSLYKAITDYMCSCIPELAGVKASQQLKPLFKAGELAGVKANYVPIKVMLLAADPAPKELMNLFDDTDPKHCLLKAQISNAGISVIDFTTPNAAKGFTDGIYTADIDAIDPYDIDRFSDTEIDYYGDAQFQKRCLLVAICKCYIYNAYLKVALEGLKVDYLDIAYIDTELLEYALEQYNNCCYRAYSNITGTPRERASRREVIKNVFTPIETEDIKQSINKTDRLLQAFEMLKEQGRIIDYFDRTQELIKELLEALDKGVNS